MSKYPIRVMCGGLTNTIWAIRRYSERPGGLIIAATNGKDDVTGDAIAAVAEHRMRCENAACRCGWSTDDWRAALSGRTA